MYSSYEIKYVKSLKNQTNVLYEWGDKRKFSFPKNRRRGSYRNPTLKNGDIIILDNTLITSSAAVINEITAPFVGIYSSYGLFKAILD